MGVAELAGRARAIVAIGAGAGVTGVAAGGAVGWIGGVVGAGATGATSSSLVGGSALGTMFWSSIASGPSGPSGGNGHGTVLGSLGAFWAEQPIANRQEWLPPTLQLTT